MSPLLTNRVVTKESGDWIYLMIDGKEINLSGDPAVADGAEFTWDYREHGSP